MEEEKPKKKYQRPKRTEYFRKYRQEHREELNEYQRKRYAENPELKSRYNKTYREKVKAQKMQEQETKESKK